MFGFVGSRVERMEPIGYQCAVQSKEEEEEAEEGEEEEEGEEDVEGGGGEAAAARAAREVRWRGRSRGDDDDVDDFATRRKHPFPCALVGLPAAFGDPRPAAVPAGH